MSVSMLGPSATIQERLYHRIRGMIVAGEIKQGEKIVERRLAERVGSSRVPVREALIRLSSDGLIQNIPRWGFQVRQYSIKEAVELYELREAVEGMAARFAAARGSDLQLRKISDTHRKMVEYIKKGKEDSVDMVAKYDEEFHRAILEASGNERFLRTFNIFSDEHICLERSNLGWPKLSHSQSAELLRRVVQRHEKIVNAIIDRNEDLAETAMREYIRIAKEGTIAGGKKVL